MKVQVFTDSDDLLWSHEAGETPSIITNSRHLQDGTQKRIIDALVAALVEARGQLGSRSLQVVNAISDIRATSTKIDSDVPIVRVGDANTRG